MAGGIVLAAMAMAAALMLALAMVRVRGPTAILVTQMMAVVEAIPVYAWVLIIFVAAGDGMTSGITVLFLIAVTPFASNIMRGELIRLLDQPFVQVARMAGVARPLIILRHVLPNARSTIIPLCTQLIGLGIAIPGAIGILGFTNRTALDIGVILFRGKENAAAHPMLLISAVGALMLIYGCIMQVARLFDRRDIVKVAISY